MENKELAESNFIFMDSVTWQGTYVGSIIEKREVGTITMCTLQCLGGVDGTPYEQMHCQQHRVGQSLQDF